MTEFPRLRLRRLRRTEGLRASFAESRIAPRDLIAPLFVKESLHEPAAISSMPGHHQHTIESMVKEARELVARDVSGVILFGVPAVKDPDGSQAYNPTGIAQTGIRALKDELGDERVVVADLCMCEYTDHGHCGLLRGQEVDNDPTLEAYGKIAVSLAEAGADAVAPSGMMDGQVAAIRAALDGAGFPDVPIVSYAVKYASALYGPFREAAEGAPAFGDRRGYQQDPANRHEALREAELDVREGADALIVKPALPYLDVLAAIKEQFGYPTVAYNVSGEYSMVKAAAERGWLDERAAVMEMLGSIRRAGADLIITYHAKQAADWLA